MVVSTFGLLLPALFGLVFVLAGGGLLIYALVSSRQASSSGAPTENRKGLLIGGSLILLIGLCACSATVLFFLTLMFRFR